MSPELQQLLVAGTARVTPHERARLAFSVADAASREAMQRALLGSDFIADACVRDTELLEWLLAADGGGRSLDVNTAHAMVARAAGLAGDAVPDEADFMADLRRIRQREMARIAWRDLAGNASLDETLRSLSGIADALIAAAVDYAGRALQPLYGWPRGADGSAQPLIVLGMGKLGGGELNFSSDIDLIFVFPSPGDTDGARSIANEDYFTRLGRLVIKLLDAPTEHGIVARVDMRLRPFGDSGPLAVSAGFLEDYLATHGRDWERYAWVKARAITGQAEYAQLFDACVRPFVYRRYLDFGMFDSLREMKALIAREVERRDLAEHVKLGPGGIREIEFIVQALQLVRGGQDRRLRTTSLLEALTHCSGSKLLESTVTAELRAAYEFLRRLENRLQMLDDRQTHTLPTAALSRERIAVAMGYADWTALTQALDGVRGTVTRHFATLLAGTSSVSQREHAAGQTFAAAWERGADADEIASALTKVADAPACAALLAEFRGSTLVRRLDGAGRKRLDALLERCVADLASVQQPATALRRVLRILEAIGPRSAYFALLNENPAARSRLWELCGYGDFLAGQIAAAPILLDELIDESLYHALPSRAELERDAADRLLAAGDGDPEREVEALRRFQQAAVFRVAVADLTGRLPLMRVSDWLTDIAEIIVEHAMQLAWRQMIAQFGVPMCGMDSARRPVRVAAIGYGKLGGRELGYSSDLDLVFVHDSDGERQETDAAKPVDNQVFFVRLAQRIVHLLSMHSAAGRLYEVDQRLRPSGKGGMLITRIGAFAEYQRNEAWTWEHQALLHARSVAGNPELCVEFERVRTTTLAEHVKRDSLAAEVRSMRERMRRELSRAGPGQFDLKQDRGGIADVEFLAQYWALRHAREHPPVAMFSDTIRQLESLASADLVPQAEVDQLVGAYRAYRTRTHRLSLEGGLPVVADSEFTAERAAVVAIWGTVFGAAA